MSELTQTVQQYARNTTNAAFTYILLGFSLAAALGWTELVKYLIKHYVKVPGTAGAYMFLYAVVVTILAVVVYDFIKRLSPDVQQLPVVGVVY